VEGEGGIDVIVLGNEERGHVPARVALREGGRGGGREEGVRWVLPL